MRLRILTVTVIAIFYATVLYTENGCGTQSRLPLPEVDIEGKITDADTGAVVTGAEVIARQGHAKVMMTTTSGGYGVTGMHPGEVTLTVSAPRYATATRSLIAVKGKNHFDIALAPAP